MKPLTVADLEQQCRAAMAAGDWPLAERLGHQLDRIPTPQVSCLQAALWYAEQGLHVFPLQPGSKIPYPGTHGFQDATTNPDTITAWWTAKPQSNLAIATGHTVDVIDIDGPTGVLSWARCTDLPQPLGVVETPRPGGSHLYVPATGMGNRAKVLPGVDYRGAGGYVVAPPSILAPDPTGERDYAGRYGWRTPINLTTSRAAA